MYEEIKNNKNASVFYRLFLTRLILSLVFRLFDFERRLLIPLPSPTTMIEVVKNLLFCLLWWKVILLFLTYAHKNKKNNLIIINTFLKKSEPRLYIHIDDFLCVELIAMFPLQILWILQ